MKRVVLVRFFNSNQVVVIYNYLYIYNYHRLGIASNESNPKNDNFLSILISYGDFDYYYYYFSCRMLTRFECCKCVLNWLFSELH